MVLRFERLCRFLNYSDESSSTNIKLVDGDHYESKNYKRQDFTFVGNKASIKASEMKGKFQNLSFQMYEEYVNDKNVSYVIKENDIVFICVDNHKSRMVINNYCKKLKNVTIISGGNELTDGNVQIYVRKEGKNITPDLCMYHPEIANPGDKLPDEMSCEELSVSEPQLYFTNLGVATIMCWAFYNILNNKYDVSEVYFDIISMTADAKKRTTKK
jgi:molybdopterin/thiamine biosynthesis adenylyltransferase